MSPYLNSERYVCLVRPQFVISLSLFSSAFPSVLVFSLRNSLRQCRSVQSFKLRLPLMVPTLRLVWGRSYCGRLTDL